MSNYDQLSTLIAEAMIPTIRHHASNEEFYNDLHQDIRKRFPFKMYFKFRKDELTDIDWENLDHVIIASEILSKLVRYFTDNPVEKCYMTGCIFRDNTDLRTGKGYPFKISFVRKMNAWQDVNGVLVQDERKV